MPPRPAWCAYWVNPDKIVQLDEALNVVASGVFHLLQRNSQHTPIIESLAYGIDDAIERHVRIMYGDDDTREFLIRLVTAHKPEVIRRVTIRVADEAEEVTA